ncbi:MAG TPA: MBL fold metallo-hydrolase [Steroidobacteraceae bacterium]|jgi:glyoxylase-like metal-dependent hydrolase (beta-lactamase superfamily II)|nr:MBL fold metallo-hydrolase [Steroidobacteraceae bacterium]
MNPVAVLSRAAVALAPGVRRILAGNAGLMTGPGTNTYLLGTSEVTVLDPGPDETPHLQNILAAAGAPIRWIVTTHTHRDHSPLAARLSGETGARVIGLPAPLDGRQDESFRPDLEPVDGETLELGDVTLTAIFTPGHASNCVCYLLARERLVFTGDHVLGGVSPVILPPDGDMSAYLDSLDKLGRYDFEYIAPGHGDLMSRGKRVLEMLRAHRMGRERKVLAGLATPATLDALTPAVYDDVPADRHVWARFTLEAHLIKLEREGKVVEKDGLWQLVP